MTLRHGEGVEITQDIMASGGPKLAIAVLLTGLLIYLFWRLKGYKINLILFLIIFLFPTGNLYFDVGFHLFYHRILLILYGVFFFIKKLTMKGEKQGLINFTTIIALLFLFFSLPALAVVKSYGAFFRYWFAFLSGILVYIFILEDIKDANKLEGIIIACLSSGLIWAIVGLWLFFTGNTTLMVYDVNYMYRLSSLCGDPNYFCGILVGWIPIAFIGFLYKKCKFQIISLLSFIVMVFALVFTYSRGGYLALIICGFVLMVSLFYYSTKLRSIINYNKFISFGIIISIILVVSLFKVTSLESRVYSITGDETGGSGRLLIWNDTIRVGLSNFFGVGLGNLGIYKRSHPSEFRTGRAVAHNAFLNTFAETGVLGIILYLFFTGSYLIKIKYASKIASMGNLVWFLGVYAGIIGITITQCFMSNVYNENIFVQIALLLSIINIDPNKNINDL